MANIIRFEDIEAWKKARELTKSVYKVTSQGSFAKDFGLRDQIRRAAVSVMSNIAEGFERDGNRELINFLTIAKGSTGEIKSQQYTALDLEYINQREFDALVLQVEDTAKMLSGFIKYLNNSSFKRSKYKKLNETVESYLAENNQE